MQMTSTNLLYIYVIIINVVTFFIYGLDKSRAKAGQWRIPEAQLIFLAVVLVFTGCEKKETISMPFDVADVNNIEMYRNVVPNSAEKQVITKTDDIEDIYFLFSGNEGIILRL